VSGVITRRYLVSGKVQGVFFRVSTADEGNRLGLSGTVRNLPDGRVEVFAAGIQQLLEQFESWLSVGPERAVVDSVEVEDAAPETVAAGGFSVVC